MLLCNDEVLRANADELEFGSRLAAAARTSVKRNNIMLIIVSQLHFSICLLQLHKENRPFLFETI